LLLSKEICLVILCLAILGGLFYRSQLGSWDNFIYRPGSQYSDLTITFWPNIYYIQQSLANDHRLPLWRTLINSGSPIDSDPQAGLWYLPNILFLLFTAARGFNLLFLLHFVFAGIGMWLWARRLGLSPVSRTISVIACVFAPKAIAHLGFGHLGLYYGYAYVPWIFWSAELAVHGRLRPRLYLGILFGLQIIISPQMAFYTAILVTIYGWVRGIQSIEIKNFSYRLIQPLVRLLSGFVLGGLLSAAQTVPLLRFARMSGRLGLGIAETSISALPLRYFWGFLAADYNGYMEYMLYAGIPALLLAFCALLGKKYRFLWFFVLFGLVYSLGMQTPLYNLIYHLSPFADWLRSPARIMLVIMVILALLAGYGFDQIRAGINNARRRPVNLALYAMGLMAVILSGGYFLMMGNLPGNILAFGIITPLTVLLIMLGLNQKLPVIAIGITLGCLLLVDLWIVDSTLVEGRSAAEVFQNRPIGEYFAGLGDSATFRVYSPSYSIPRQIGALFQIETADGVDPLYLAYYDKFMQLASGVPRTQYDVTIPAFEGGGEIATINRNAVPNLILLGLVNVRYLVAQFPLELEGLDEINRINGTYIYENADYLPRAYAVSEVIAVDDNQAALQRVLSIDPLRIAIAESGFALDNPIPAKTDIQWEQVSPDQIRLKVNTDERVFLVISQVYYPDWKLRVDGKLSRLYKTDSVISGLYLDPGKHSVELTYQPVYTYLGILVTIITSMFIFCGLIKCKR
jgi:hypothetical protein